MNNRCFASIATLAAMGVVLLLRTPASAAGQASSPIAKAITGAYLSSGGNAFSTRTASEIVQQNFPPEPSCRQ